MSIPFKVKACYVVFVLLVVIGIITYVSGFVLWLILPRGQIRSRLAIENTFLGLNRSSWEDVHIISSILLLVLTLIHLILNWSWIKNVTKCLITPRRPN